MKTVQLPHLRIVGGSPALPLRLALDAFLVSREAMRVTARTLSWYGKMLSPFLAFLEAQGIADPKAVTAQHVRAFLVSLQRRNLKDNTIHAHARAVKTFLRAEGIIPDNPTERVAMPRLDRRIMPAFAPDDVKKLLAACQGLQESAIVLALLDTGCRASEFLALNVGDVDVKTGAVRVRQGKGRKDRVAFLGAKARKALLRYMMARGDVQPDAALWVRDDTGERWDYDAFHYRLRLLGKRAGVKNGTPHTFRRTCALWSLRAGMNIYALQQLMGHSDLTVLRWYLALVQEDLEEAHRKHGAVDNML